MRREIAQNNLEKKSKNSSYKNIIIILLLILTIFLALYTIFFSRNTKSKNDISKFVKSINQAQSSLSYYLGKTSVELFNTYSVEQILTGVSDINKPNDTSIKNNKNESILPLVNISTNSVIKNNDMNTYLILEDNIKKVLNVNLNSYTEIRYYIQKDGTIKVRFDTAPSWWDESLDLYKLGAQ